MKAKVTVEFTALRPGAKKNSTIHVGEIVEDGLAAWAVNNGHGKQVSDDTPVGKPDAAPAPAKAPEKKGGKGKAEKAGGAGDGGEGGGEGQ